MHRIDQDRIADLFAREYWSWHQTLTWIATRSREDAAHAADAPDGFEAMIRQSNFRHAPASELSDQTQLLEALSRGDLSCLGRRSEVVDLSDVPAAFWRLGVQIEYRGRNFGDVVAVFEDHQNGGRNAAAWRDLRLKRGDVLRLWPDPAVTGETSANEQSSEMVAAESAAKDDQAETPEDAGAQVNNAARSQARVPYMKYVPDYIADTGAPGENNKGRWANFQDWLKSKDAVAYEACKSKERSTQFERTVKNTKAARR